jgi:hypothetical protein
LKNLAVDISTVLLRMSANFLNKADYKQIP